MGFIGRGFRDVGVVGTIREETKSYGDEERKNRSDDAADSEKRQTGVLRSGGRAKSRRIYRFRRSKEAD